MANNFVTATCPNCNSPLQIKEGQDFVKCEYCGTISSAPKAIEYHQHQSTSYNFSGANPVVNFSNGQDLETLVKNADMHLKLKNYADAQSIYEKISKEYPHDYRGWWGLILAKSRELTDTDIFIRKDSISGYISLSAEYYFITSTWNKVQKTAPQKIKDELASKYQPFYDTCYTKYEKALYTYSVPRYTKEIEEYQTEIQRNREKISYKDKDIKDSKQCIESRQRSIRKSTASIAWRTLWGIVSGVISLALVGYALALLFTFSIITLIYGVLVGAVAIPFVLILIHEREEIKFSKDSIKSSKNDINKYNSEIAKCQKEIDDLNKEIKKIESDIKEAQANLTKAEKKLAELTRKA